MLAARIFFVKMCCKSINFSQIDTKIVESKLMSKSKPAAVILFFIDGLGIGEPAQHNPLFTVENIEPLANFREVDKQMIFDGILVSTDARLGVEGRPQSASGQTTILTGVNAPKFLGYHKQGFPNEKLREVINEHSLFRRLRESKIDEVVFANAYTPQFFTEKQRWKSATTCAVEAAGMQFRKLPDLFGRKALFHDFTNQTLRSRGIDAPIFSPSEAAEILADLSENYRFTLYEHFLTDKIGHDQNFEWAKIHLPQLAEFIRETLQRLDLENTTLILTSDHGNIEDLSVRNHTLNNVPTIVWGRNRGEIASQIKDLTDITPAILQLLTK
jgi:2,3-bisphosphoglycerate-independent phosphoglycerate mutase